MTGLAWGLLAAAAALAVGDWMAVHRRRPVLEYVCKPATMAALAGVALAIDDVDGVVRAAFVVAVLLSLVGDVFLMLPSDRFVPGLAAFLLAHVAYVVGFQAEGVTGAGLVVGLAVATLALVSVGARVLAAVRASPEPGLAGPVGAYVAVILAMVASAVGTEEPVAIAGAILFAGSDSLIAWDRFVATAPWRPLAIIVSYHLGQALLVLSLAT